MTDNNFNFDNENNNLSPQNNDGVIEEKSDEVTFATEEPIFEIDNEIEIDPAIESITVEDSEQPKTEYFTPSEPLTPVMPQIETTKYEALEPRQKNQGLKVFAVVLALLVIISGCLTGGYLLGSYDKSAQNSEKVDLASKPEPKDAKSVSEIYKVVNPSIVGIYVYNSTGIVSSASGVVYSKDGLIVTNDHIYSSATSPKFKVYTSDGKMYDADFVAGDTRSDLAVLKVKNPAGLIPATFGNSSELSIGETVVAVGRPNGATEKAIASQGVISDTGRRTSITSSYTSVYIQTDTAINPGSSGGALCNLYGQVVGITSAKIVGEQYEGVGFAIPTTVMKKNVELLIKHKYVKGRAKLGISYQEIDALSAEINNTPTGLMIASIDQSSDLYGKSVEINDIITKVNGVDIKSSEDILDVIDQKTSGDILTLTIYSAKKKVSFEVSVKLLEDEGGSSYNKAENGNTSSNDSSSDKDDYNKSEFDFPIGE